MKQVKSRETKRENLQNVSAICSFQENNNDKVLRESISKANVVNYFIKIFSSPNL